MSRTHLIGMGIVCGLEPRLSADGKSITISSGVGVTSQGHLISMPQRTLTRKKDYPVHREFVYGPFVNEDRTPLFPVEELLEESQTEGATPFVRADLSNKQLLLFVELEAKDARNCSPDSCDDKGRQVHWNLRVLLVPRDALSPADSLGEGAPPRTLPGLPWIRLPRFDVEASALPGSAALLAAYQKLLHPEYLRRWESQLKQAYILLSPLVHDLFSSNPFDGFAERFRPVMPGTDDLFELVHIQYYYSFLSDVLEAYEALRIEGSRCLTQCLPKEDLFARHLFLGLADPAEAGAGDPKYRHGFIPSAALSGCRSRVADLRLLMRRLVEMVRGFEIPDRKRRFQRLNSPLSRVKITPSRLGTYSLEGKAIPYYYSPDHVRNSLYPLWDLRLREQGRAEQTLSYHSDQYNAEDDAVARPCAYDLEPYNFLRIEGHIGQPIRQAMEQVQALRQRYRLPFEPLALGADLRSLAVALRRIRSGNWEDLGEWAQAPCVLADLQTLYSSLRSTLICTLCRELKYYYDLGRGMRQDAAASVEEQGMVSSLPLFAHCDPGHRFYPRSLGAEFENYYSRTSASPYAAMGTYMMASAPGPLQKAGNLLGFMYLIHELGMSLPENMEDFDYRKYRQIELPLVQMAREIRSLLDWDGENSGLDAQELAAHLDLFIHWCTGKELRHLMETFLERKAYAYFLGKFGHFVKKHPGIQHKGGVSMGGTFLLVYHETPLKQEEMERSMTLNRQAATSTLSLLGDQKSGSGGTDTGSSLGLMGESGLNRSTSGGIRINQDYLVEADQYQVANLRVNQEGKRGIRDSGAWSIEDWIRFGEREAAVGRPKEEQAIEDVLEDLAPGTVIADFYLPYICASDCPPIQFAWTAPAEEPSSDKPVIGLETETFCQHDQGDYPLNPVPAGGELSGPGVSRNADGQWVFRPAEVTMDGAEKKEVRLLYQWEGVQVDQVVVVYGLDQDRIVAREEKAPGTWSFHTASGKGDQWEWHFGDGNTSDKSHPQHRYEKEGTYTVKLQLRHGPCSQALQTKILVGKPSTPRTCMPLSEFYLRFSELKSEYPKEFKEYAELNSGLAEATEVLFEWQSLTEKEGINYLIKTHWGSQFNQWVEQTRKAISNPKVQQIALAHFGLLMEMMTHLLCRLGGQIKEADERLVLSKNISLINAEISSWAERKWDPASKTILQELLRRWETEYKRVQEAGWSKEAPDYTELLARWIKAWKAVLESI